MTQFIKRHSIDELVQSLAAYLPGGEMFIAAWVAGTNQNDLLRGLCYSLLDAENYLQVFNSEFIPDNTNVFIDEWESALGIPDDCFPGADEPDLSIRRNHILVKLASLGVQTSADFVNLATILGFPDTTVISGVNEGITPISEARFTIVVGFPAPPSNIFPLNFPIPFGTTQFAILECLFTKLKPANCVIQFQLQTGIQTLFQNGSEYEFQDNIFQEF